MTKEKRIISTLLSIVLFCLLFLGSGGSVSASSTPGQYWLKINEQRNVVTAYKYINKKWTPVRAMLCSTGLNDTTPKGTFYTRGKWRWGVLMNDVHGQYCTHITSDILFHSVYYNKSGNPSTQFTNAFNLLGQSASHGCVRLSVMDAKWIYDQCKVGTRVTIFRSSQSGPLGKPRGIKVPNRGFYWDPTDPNPSNPYFIMKRPLLTISAKKPLTVQYGRKYNLTDYVYATDPNTFMTLKQYIKVSKIHRYSEQSKAYVTASFSTKRVGTYKITYGVKDPYGRSSTTTTKVKVIDNLNAPFISGAVSRSVNLGDTDAAGSVTAKQSSADRTKDITVHIKSPTATQYMPYSYAKAKQYTFAEVGKYMIRYTITNKYAPYKSSNKTITIRCLASIDPLNRPA